MGNKIIVEFDREELARLCEHHSPKVCKGCEQTDKDLLNCNLIFSTKFKIKEQNNGNKRTED